MAEESGGASWWGAWGTEFLSSVRDKSAEAVNMVKQDLSEFVCTIQHDTSAVVADTATAVKESLKVEEEEPQGTSTRFKQGVSKFLGTLSNSLRENISHVATAAAAVASDGPEPVFDRMQARLHEIQTDPATFCCEPDGHLAMYEEWSKTFDPEEHKGEISELLVNVPEIRALYAKLVPSAVSHVLFWQRYFYKVHQLEQEEEKRAALVARANQAEDEELGWGDEDFWETEEAGVDSKHATSEEDKALVSGNLTEVGNKEVMKAPRDEDETEEADVARQPAAAAAAAAAAAVERQEKADTTKALIKDQGTSEKPSEGERLEVKCNEESLQESDELLGKRTETIPQSQPTNPEVPSVQHKDLLLSKPSKTLTTDASTEQTSIGELQTATHKRDNSSGSLDSSWSKLSEANSDKEAGLKEIRTGSGHSSSSSSGVLVPSVDDKDVDWDDDLDLNDDDDMSEEEVKRIMESMAANKQTKENQDDGDGDDDDWENWD